MLTARDTAKYNSLSEIPTILDYTVSTHLANCAITNDAQDKRHLFYFINRGPKMDWALEKKDRVLKKRQGVRKLGQGAVPF